MELLSEEIHGDIPGLDVALEPALAGDLLYGEAEVGCSELYNGVGGCVGWAQLGAFKECLAGQGQGYGLGFRLRQGEHPVESPLKLPDASIDHAGYHVQDRTRYINAQGRALQSED